MNLPVKIQLLDRRWGTIWPLQQKHSSDAAALDLRLAIDADVVLAPSACELLPTGIAIHIGQSGYFGLITPRSGWGHKGLVLGNGVGVIDADYQGEIKLSLWNRNPDKTLELRAGERVAQLLFLPCLNVRFEQVTSFAPSARGGGGFGSTGSH